MVEWFEVDREGLRKLLERRGKAFIIYELIQNGWDQNVSVVEVKLEMLSGKRAARLVVTDDDPQGFASLRDAYTLFADSRKKKDAAKRGRFNLGEKLVLAFCENARIMSTTGTVIFDAQGRRAA